MSKISSKKIDNIQGNSVVYDISLDGTVVNALGMNVMSNTDGFNFSLPKKFRYTEKNPYIGKGLNREVKEGCEYTGFEADVAEFNDMYMGKVYSEYGVQKMGLGIDEVVDSTINFSRKNYSDYFPNNPYPKDVKLVGNSIKSKKMPEYIERFLGKGIRLLLQGKGQEFIEEYYDYIEKIYNYRIPLKEIATKGKIKKSLEQYLQDVKEITKAGRPKSRQAWYELAIANNMSVGNGDTLYYVNTGKSKSHADIKKINHYMHGNDDITKVIEKEWRLICKTDKRRKAEGKDKWLSEEHPEIHVTEEIVFNSRLIPQWVMDSDNPVYCSDMPDSEYIKYNCPKYINMFNQRIKPLMVCFDRSIRDSIMIDNPNDRNYFTKEQCILVSGQPNAPGDQDTYEQLMTMEDKEIRFWTENNIIPPFVDECGMGDWDEIVSDYNKRMEEEKRLGIDKEREAMAEILSGLKKSEIDNMLEDGTVPQSILKLSVMNPVTYDFMSKKYEGVKLCGINDIVEMLEKNDDYEE